MNEDKCQTHLIDCAEIFFGFTMFCVDVQMYLFRKILIFVHCKGAARKKTLSKETNVRP